MNFSELLMKLKHKYNTDKPLPAAHEYWSFAFYGWLLLEHDDGTQIEVDANYATSSQIRIERIINGKFKGNYDDYTIIGYKIRKDNLYKNRPRHFSDFLTDNEKIEFGFKNFQLKLNL